MKKKPLLFPFGGLYVGIAYQHQPPYHTLGCQNVWPVDVFQNRARGGSRPGLEKAYAEQLGIAGNREIRMMSRVRVARTDGSAFWAEDFNWPVYGGYQGDTWAAATGFTGGFPSYGYGYILDRGGVVEEHGAIRAAFDDFDASQTYSVSLYIRPHLLRKHVGYYYILLRGDDTTPEILEDGVVARLFLLGNEGDWTLDTHSYVGGAETTYAEVDGQDASGLSLPGWFTCEVSGDILYVKWRGELIKTIDPLPAAAGDRLGFGIKHVGGIYPAHNAVIQDLLVRYYTAAYIEETRTMLVASAGGKLYRETVGGAMEEPSPAPAATLSIDRRIAAVERNQLLFVADRERRPNVNRATPNGEVTGTSFDDAGITDWTDTANPLLRRLINPDSDVIVITGGAGGTTNGTYTIASVAAGAITLDVAPGNGTCAYQILRAPKIFDPATDTLVVWEATSGHVPSGCEHICLYNDRIVLANETGWFMSRQGDPYDFDYGQSVDDVGRAMYGAAADSGMIAEELTAVFPVGRDYCVFACSDQLWRLRGDPAIGGRLDAVDRNIGIIDRQAWCYGEGGEIFFLSRMGFCRLGPGIDDAPEQLLGAQLPTELHNIDPTQQVASMVYDVWRKAVHIYVTRKVDQSIIHYWYHRPTGTIWPMVMNKDYEPFATFRYPPIARQESAVLLGSRDGYIRNFSQPCATDDGTTIASHITYGPIRLGGADDQDGIFAYLVGALAAESGPVDWSLFVGKNHEAVNTAIDDDDSRATGELTAGYGHTIRPQVRGGSFALKLANAEPCSAWAVEHLTFGQLPGGAIRA